MDLDQDKSGVDLPEESFDFDFDGEFDFDDPTSRKPTMKETAKTIIDSAGKPLAKEAGKAVIERVLPAGFEYDYNDLVSMSKFTTNLFKKSFEEVRDSAGKLLPKELRNRLGVRDDGESYRRKSDRQLREESIAASLDNIFQDKDFSKDQDPRIVTHTGEKAFDVAELSLSKLQTNFLGEVSNNTSKLSAFFLGVGKNYYQKSLELKYRSYYIQQDQLKITTKYLAGITKQLELVIKNTALPENVKITQADRLSTKFKQNITDSIYQRSWTNNEFVNRIKRNTERKVNELTQLIRDASDAAIDARDMMSDMPVNKSDLLISKGSSFLGELLGRRFGGKLGDKYNKHFGGKDDLIQTIAGRISLASRGLPTFIEKLRRKTDEGMDKSYEKTGLRGVVSRGFYGLAGNALELLDRDSRSSSLRHEVFSSFNKPAIFDNNVHRSITEGIPGYLAEILKETQDLNNKYSIVNKYQIQRAKTRGELKTPEKKIFSYHDRKLVTTEELKTSTDMRLIEGGEKHQAINNANASVLRTARENLSRSKDPTNLRWKKVVNNKKSSELLNTYLYDMARYEDLDMSFEELFEKAINPEEADTRIEEYVRNRKDLQDVIRAIVSSTKIKGREKETEFAKDRFALNMETATKDYPILPVKELFSGVSVLAKSTYINDITDSQANIISRAFAGRIYEGGGRPLLPTEKDLKAVLTYVPESSFKEIKKPYMIFLNDVNKVTSSPLRNDKARLDILFSEVSNAIMNKLYNIGEGKDSLKELFEEVGQLHPELQAKGPLNYRNFIEKTINVSDLGEMVSEEEIDSLFESSLEDDVVSGVREEETESTIMEEVLSSDKTDTTSTTKKRTASRKPNVIKKKGKNTDINDFKNGFGKRKLDATYKKVKENSSDINKILKNINKEGLRNTCLELSRLLNSQVQAIKTLMSLESREWKQINDFLRKQVEEIKREGSDKYKEARDRLMKIYNQRVRRSTAFELIKEQLESLSGDLTKLMDQFSEEDFESGFKELHARIAEVLEDIKTILNKGKGYAQNE